VRSRMRDNQDWEAAFEVAVIAGRSSSRLLSSHGGVEHYARWSIRTERNTGIDVLKQTHRQPPVLETTTGRRHDRTFIITHR